MIEWEPIMDNHVRGTCRRGPVWIRLGRAGEVTAFYTLFEGAVKYLPESEEELALEAMKVRAELILEHHDLAEELAKKNRR